MPIFIPYFLCLFALALLTAANRRCCPMEKKATYDFWLSFVLPFVLLCLFSCFRHLVGGNIDEYAYRNRWLHFSQIGLGEALALSHEREFLFALISWSSAHLFETSQGIIICTAFLTLGGMLWSFRKYSLDFQYAVLLFLAMGILWNTFNGIQQSLATAFLLVFADKIAERNLPALIMITLCCMTIHQSALFFLYFYFIAKYKTNSWSTIIFIILLTTSVMLFAYKSVSMLAGYLNSLEQYANYNELERPGVNAVTILISFAPIALIGMFGKKIAASDPVTRFAACLCCVDAGIMLASSVDTYIARFAMYTTPFVVIFLSRINQFFKKGNEYALFKLVSLGLYGIVVFLRMRGTDYYWGIYGIGE